MKTTYLKDYFAYLKKEVAFLPVGTLEWHGNHLPIETDYLVAEKICEILNKKVKGYVLPPIYLGTDRTRIKNNRKFIGMDYRLGKKLKGNLYYLRPELLFSMLSGLIDNLNKQGFRKIVVVTGHGGSKHVEILKKIEKKNKNVYLINPYEGISFDLHHADEYETSLFWACYRDEIKKSKIIKISSSDDFIKYAGYDPRKKASFKIGNKILKEMIKNSFKIIKKI